MASVDETYRCPACTAAEELSLIWQLSIVSAMCCMRVSATSNAIWINEMKILGRKVANHLRLMCYFLTFPDFVVFFCFGAYFAARASAIASMALVLCMSK